MLKELFIGYINLLLVAGLWWIGANRPLTPIDVTVTMRDYVVELTPKVVTAGHPLRFTIINQGVVEHETVLEKAGAVNIPLDLKGQDSTSGVVLPGETHTAVWTIREPGRYQLACHLPGHYQGGMVQRFEVTPNGDFIHGQPAPAVRTAAGAALFLFLEGLQLGFRRYFTGSAATITHQNGLA